MNTVSKDNLHDSGTCVFLQNKPLSLLQTPRPARTPSPPQLDMTPHGSLSTWWISGTCSCSCSSSTQSVAGHRPADTFLATQRWPPTPPSSCSSSTAWPGGWLASRRMTPIRCQKSRLRARVEASVSKGLSRRISSGSVYLTEFYQD